jgi:hypothetical protein
MKANSLLFNLFIIAGLPLLNTSCGLTESMTRGHCMEATDGYQVCVKSDQVKCERVDGLFERNILVCSAFGTISSPITGEKRHWSSSQEGNEWTRGRFQCKEAINSTLFTCLAAAHHGKL